MATGSGAAFLAGFLAAGTLTPPPLAPAATWEKEIGPLSQGVQEGRQALRMLHVRGVEVRRKRPRGFR